MTGLGTPLSYAYSQKPTYCNAASEVDPGPHAAHTVSGVHYCYDAVGNQTRSSDGRSIRYTAFDLPDRITHSASNKAIEFDYGASRERIRRKDIPSVTVGVTPNLVTHFVGNAEIVRYATGKVEVRRYVAGMIRVQTRESPTYTSTREDYVLTDAQGSTYAIVKDTGSVLGIMGFDPWGLRRVATNWRSQTGSVSLDAGGGRFGRGDTRAEPRRSAGLSKQGRSTVSGAVEPGHLRSPTNCACPTAQVSAA